MFSGIGSLSDLNQKFVKFTSNISNLDNLQDDSNASAAGQETIISKSSESLTSTSNSIKLADDSRITQQLALLQSELDTKISDIVYLKSDLETKDRVLQDQVSICEDLRNQLQNAEKSERQIQSQLELLSQQEHRKRVDLEDRIEELVSTCEIQKMELSKLNSAAQSSDPEKFSDLQLVHDLEARNEEVKTLKARCKTHKNSLRDSEDRFAEVERKSKALQAQLDGELASYTEKVSHMETELLTRDRHIKTLSETAERNFNEQGSKAEATIHELKKRLDSEKKASQSREEDLQSELKESEAKLKGLVDKTKELVQKYAEVKAANASLEQERLHAASSTNNRDSEVMALRLKLENMERSSSDYKVRTVELAERFAEAQRELNRNQERTRELQSKIDILTIEKEQAEKQVSNIVLERAELLERVSESSQQISEKEQNYIEQLRLSELRCGRLERDSQATILGLEMKISDLNDRVSSEVNTASALDEYKKRAQLTLKKANRDVANLTAECTQLREQNALLQGQEKDNAAIIELQSKVSHWEQQFLHAEETISLLRDEIEQLEQSRTAKDREIQQLLLAQQQQRLSEEMEKHYRPRREGKAGQHGSDDAEAKLRAMTEELLQLKRQVHEQEEMLRVKDNREAELLKQQQQQQRDVDGNHANANADEKAKRAGHSASSGRMNMTDIWLDDCNDDDRTVATVSQDDSWAIAASRQGQRKVAESVQSQPVRKAESREMKPSDKVEGKLEDKAERRSGDNEVPDPAGGGMELDSLNNGSMVFVNELQTQLEYLKKSLSLRGIDLEAALQELQQERVEKRKLEGKVEELKAFLDRIKKLQEGPDSAINMEYLKNCVYKYMASNEMSEKKRLYPVICTILKLTNQEKKAIEQVLSTQSDRGGDINATLTNITTFASTSLETLWDGLWG